MKIDYYSENISKIRHDLIGHIRRQDIIVKMVMESIKNGTEVDQRLFQDMEEAFSTVKENWLELLSLLLK